MLVGRAALTAIFVTHTRKEHPMDHLKSFVWQRIKSVPVLNPKTAAPMLLTVDTRHNPITGKWEAAISGGLLFSNEARHLAIVDADDFIRRHFAPLQAVA